MSTSSTGEASRRPLIGGPEGYRILVVDDNPSIHDDFRRIFTPERTGRDGLDDLVASVFGLASSPSSPAYSLDHVTQGQDALERVVAARKGGRPYALLFMDVRMPPGWDGVETSARVLEADPDVHVVLCTAYSERGWRAQVEALSGRDRVLILKKPFDIAEVQQLARALCDRWLFTRRDRARMRDLERSVTEQRGRLAAAADHLRNEIASRTMAENRLRKARRLEGLGRMAANLCHEINNPLSFMVTSTELIEQQLDAFRDRLPPEFHEELTELVQAISVGESRITRLVRNIKTFTHDKKPPTERIELERTVESAIHMLQPHLRANVELELDLSHAAPVIGWRFELEQVLINLVENAMQAMANQRLPPPRVRIATRRHDRSVCIDVIDNGPGIADENLDQIFDPFFTTKEIGKGTGLGLSICQTLTESMGGALDVSNNAGRGVTFSIYLPFAPARHSSDAAAGSGPEAAACAEQPGRILVVDDEPMVLSALEKLLQPHSVTTTTNVHDALALCGRQSFDTILCDVVMPDLDGRDFHRMLGRLRPGAESRVVFITGGSMHPSVLEFLEKTPNRYLEKPLDSGQLRAIVSEYVERRRSASSITP